MRHAMRLAVAFLLMLFLAGCLGRSGVLPGTGTNPNPTDGDGTLVVKLSTGAAPQALGPLAEEAESTHVRVRVYGPGFNLIENKVIPPGDPEEVAVTVPAGSGYTVDAITYETRPGNVQALSEAGRVTGVSVFAEAVTETAITLSGYTLTVSAPDSVTEGFEYVVRGTITGPNIWGGSTYFKISDTPWSSDDEYRPGLAIENARIVENGPDYVVVEYKGYAPAVDEPTTFYYGFYLWSHPSYYNSSLGLRLIALDIPSVDAGEDLLTITVNPL